MNKREDWSSLLIVLYDMGTTSLLKTTGTFGASPGTESWLFWRDYGWIFVSPNVNGKTEKASKTYSSKLCSFVPKSSFNYLQMLHLCESTKLNPQRKGYFLICGNGRQGKTLLTCAQPRRIRVADAAQQIRRDDTDAHRGNTSDTFPVGKESRGALDLYMHGKAKR